MTTKIQSKNDKILDDQLKAQIVVFGKEAGRAFISGLFFSLGHLAVSKISTTNQSIIRDGENSEYDNVIDIKTA